MQEVDGLAVDLGGELRVGVEVRFRGAPVVVLVPVIGELLQVGERMPRVQPVPGRSPGQRAVASRSVQVVEVGLGDLDAEGLDVVAHGMRLGAIAERIVPRLFGIIGSWQKRPRGCCACCRCCRARRDWTSTELVCPVGDHPYHPSRRGPVAGAWLPGERAAGGGGRVPARRGRRAATAAARRRGGGGGGDRAADRRERFGRGDPGGLGAGAGQAAAGAPVEAAAPGRRLPGFCAARGLARAAGGSGRADHDRGRVPGP